MKTSRSKCYNIKYSDFEKQSNIIEQSPQGRFHKTDQLCGKGSYKDVWLAIDIAPETKDQSLVIWSDIQLPSSKLNKMRIMNEYKIMKHIREDTKSKFSSIINYIYSWYDKEKNKFIIISEYAPNGTLNNLIDGEAPILDGQIVNIIFQLLNGIDYLHNIGLIHRDIKPENIVMLDQNTVKIIDFGLTTKLDEAYNPSARVESSTPPLIPRQKSVSTNAQEGQYKMLGTPEYMAPEIFGTTVFFSEYDNSVDIYALGWILYSLLTQKYPYINICPKDISLDTYIMIYQDTTYGEYENYATPTIYTIMDREFSKIANCDKLDPPNCTHVPENIYDLIPDMKTINNLFIESRRVSPFPNKTVNYLDFFKDCVLNPENRLSTRELLNKYYKGDLFYPTKEGSYMGFGG